MTKLHELIAVEPDLKGEAQKTLAGIKQALSQPNVFIGEIKTYQPIDEGGEPFPDEMSNITMTVQNVLDLLEDSYGSWLNVGLRKEVSNTTTSANVEIGGKALFEHLPSPALLNLEAKLEELKSVYSNIPVLDAAERWNYDEGQEVYVSEPRITFRGKKVLRNHVKAEATKEHPAQVEMYSEDVRAGTWTKVIRSGAVTAKEKREMATRLDGLLRAVKQARQRANDVETNPDVYAKKLFAYINTGVV